MKRLKRFAAAFLSLLLFLMVTLKMKQIFGWSPDLVFALLLSFGFVLSVPEIIFFAGLAAWVLNFSPLPSLEIIAIALLPLFAYFLRRYAPWRPWMSLGVLAI